MANYFFLASSLLVFSLSPSVFASSESVHGESLAQVLLGLMVFLLAGKLGGFLAQKLKQPVVLGELFAGILVGNLSFFGFNALGFLNTELVFEIMASLGVILLLFEVGLESSLSELLKVGPIALLVAIIGVLVPSLLGFGVSRLLIPEASFYTQLFIGTSLCATSVGITARVLKDLKKTQSKESKIILGAAVIDDVLGLILLAIVSGLITGAGQSGSGVSLLDVIWITCKALAFLILSLVIGVRLAPLFFKTASRLKLDGSLLSTSLLFCFLLSYLANLVGLAPIVGAFAAGLIVDGTGFSKFFGEKERSIEDLIHPLSKFFVPIFFVHMGMQVRLETFTDPNVFFLGLSLAIAGIVGKQACALGVLSKDKKINRLAIGIGMIPRGEVGLIFAMIGTQLSLDGKPAISPPVYSAIIIMVILTTMITPPALKWALEKSKD